MIKFWWSRGWSLLAVAGFAGLVFATLPSSAVRIPAEVTTAETTPSLRSLATQRGIKIWFSRNFGDGC